MQSSHAASAVSAVFDDTNLVAYAGLVPVMRLAERCGLARLVAEKVKLTGAKNGAGADRLVGCSGGRHRACSLVAILARALRARGREVEVEHLHVHLPRVLKARSEATTGLVSAYT
jgi:hypothetical protein